MKRFLVFLIIIGLGGIVLDGSGSTILFSAQSLQDHVLFDGGLLLNVCPFGLFAENFVIDSSLVLEVGIGTFLAKTENLEIMGGLGFLDFLPVGFGSLSLFSQNLNLFAKISLGCLCYYNYPCLIGSFDLWGWGNLSTCVIFNFWLKGLSLFWISYQKLEMGIELQKLPFVFGVCLEKIDDSFFGANYVGVIIKTDNFLLIPKIYGDCQIKGVWFCLLGNF